MHLSGNRLLMSHIGASLGVEQIIPTTLLIEYVALCGWRARYPFWIPLDLFSGHRILFAQVNPCMRLLTK